jgi:hypothetical protein
MLALLMSRFVVTNIASNEYGLTISTSIRYYIIDCTLDTLYALSAVVVQCQDVVGVRRTASCRCGRLTQCAERHLALEIDAAAEGVGCRVCGICS